MRCEWLQRTGKERELLLFFHGWAMDPERLRALAPDGLAVAVFWDYTTLAVDFDFTAARHQYSHVALIAWSLGVWAANRTVAIPLDEALAVNGTLCPISATCGIAPEIFRGTIEVWPQEAARNRFFRRVFGPDSLPVLRRNPEEQQQELSSLERAILAAAPESGPGIFRRALIGRRDRIFPPAAQRAAWSAAGIPATELDWRHDPFAGIDSWRALLEAGR